MRKSFLFLESVNYVSWKVKYSFKANINKYWKFLDFLVYNLFPQLNVIRDK